MLDAIQLELATELVGCQVGHARNGMWGDGGEAVQAEIEQIQLGKVIQGGGDIDDPLGYHGGQVCSTAQSDRYSLVSLAHLVHPRLHPIDQKHQGHDELAVYSRRSLPWTCRVW